MVEQRFPPMPLHPPNGLAELKTTFGDFKFAPLKPPFVDVDDKWEAENLERVKNVCNTGLDIRLHKRIVPYFVRDLAHALDRCPQYKVRMLGGYCARQMMALPHEDQSKKPLSVHAWGVAWDINWDVNLFTTFDRTKPHDGLVTDLPTEFIQAFRDSGWQWGGDWAHKKDSMHFQYCTGY